MDLLCESMALFAYAENFEWRENCTWNKSSNIGFENFKSFDNAQKDNVNLLLDRQRDQKRVDSAGRTSTSMPIYRKKTQQTKRDATVHPSYVVHFGPMAKTSNPKEFVVDIPVISSYHLPKKSSTKKMLVIEHEKKK